MDVLFCDAALLKLQRDRINEPEWPEVYASVLPELEQRLRAADFVEMERFLRDAKSHGDHVRFWACSETASEQKLAFSDLTPLLDGARSHAAFLDDAREADALLTF